MSTTTNNENNPTSMDIASSSSSSSSSHISSPSTLNARAEDYSICAAKVLTFDKGWVFPQPDGAGARVVVKRSIR